MRRQTRLNPAASCISRAAAAGTTIMNAVPIADWGNGSGEFCYCLQFFSECVNVIPSVTLAQYF